MIIKKIDELKGNEILDRAVTTWDYQMILPAGALIRPDYIEKLKDLGITEVYIFCERKRKRCSGKAYLS